MSDPTQTIEVQAEKVESLAVGPHQPENAVKGQTTPAQAKVEAIASLTMSAYQKASQLVLTIEEIEKLQAEFPDEAFKPGAGGKDNLIYIEHAFLRDRMNQVFGPGQWAIVPRNRWAENYKTTAGKDAVRVYVEAMLCIRGCFAAEAIGDMDYFPHNSATNYGDAVEGAKSAALRRCVKELGVGLQAWKKDWCEGWWQRKRAGKRQPSQEPSEPPAAAPKAKPAPKQATNALADILKASKVKFIENVRTEGKLFDAWVYAVETGTILETEQLDDARVEVLFPSVSEGMTVETAKEAIRRDYELLMSDIRAHTILEQDHGSWHEKFTHAYNENKPKPKLAEKMIEVPRVPNAKREEPFWHVICPIPRKGQKRDEYLKRPDTIQSLYDAAKDGVEEAGKRLFGFANNWTPENREYNGKTYPPSDADHKFRRALDEFLDWRAINDETEGEE